MVPSYISTRGQAPPVTFAEAALEGLAPDGGLYVPQRRPSFDAHQIAEFRARSFAELLAIVLGSFIGEDCPEIDVAAVADDVVRQFSHPETTPLRQLDEDIWILELFHGPTLAFKDLAMQCLSGVIERIIAKSRSPLNILTATSGDTGAAAVRAFRNCPNVKLFTLFPQGKISEVQRRQMTSAVDSNIFNIAIKGSFDDCQGLVKSLLGEHSAAETYPLTTVNSINWARIAAQVTCYFFACSRLPDGLPAPTFVVPTGNMGNAYAAYVARRMGAPIARIIVANNANDPLARMFSGQSFSPDRTIETLSPAMDIQNASNLERLLFDAAGQDAAALRLAMDGLKHSGALNLPVEWRRHLDRSFTGASASDRETSAAMKKIHHLTGRFIDPHTAVGVVALSKVSNCSNGPKVILATADASKFPEIVLGATGQRPKLPPRLERQMEERERYETMDASLNQLRDYLEGRIPE